MDEKKWGKFRRFINVSGFIVVAFVMINLFDKNGQYFHDFNPFERFLVVFVLIYSLIVVIVNAIDLVYLRRRETRINKKTVIWGIIVGIIILFIFRLKELN